MGAETFVVMKKGVFKDANEAFWQAVEDASYEHGHGGYTGTIAEKDSFKMLELPKGKQIGKFIEECLEENETGFWNDKWGPAACLEIKGSKLAKLRDESYKGKRNFKAYVFFGLASS